MRIRLVTLIVLGYLTSAAVAKADAIYTLNSPGNFSWSFEVPSIITTDTTITSFLTTNIDPTGPAGGCTGITSALIMDPNSPGATIETLFSSCMIAGFDMFLSPINSFGTFSFQGDTLTISPSAAVPEPSSLLLLGAGLSAFGVMRRRLART